MNDGQEGFSELYAATYRRLVGVVGAVSGDREEAEDAVQEAFLRLAPRWSKVSGYDDPEAWVRAVALNQLSSRRRKVRNGIAAMLRHGPGSPSPAVSADRVDLDRALRSLPLGQRQVVVLDHLGLDGPAIARQLGLPLGTVKSRLSRARAALAPLLTAEGSEHRVAGR